MLAPEELFRVLSEPRHLLGHHDQKTHGRRGVGTIGQRNLDWKFKGHDQVATTVGGTELVVHPGAGGLQDHVVNMVDDLATRWPPDGHTKVEVTARSSSRLENQKLGGETKTKILYNGTTNATVDLNIYWRGHTMKQHMPNPKHFMPAGKEVDAFDYALTHEWGHVIDYAPVGRGHDRLAMNLSSAANKVGRAPFVSDVVPSMSRYAKAGGVSEAFAEGFTEWALTDGETENAWAKLLAENVGF